MVVKLWMKGGPVLGAANAAFLVFASIVQLFQNPMWTCMIGFVSGTILIALEDSQVMPRCFPKIKEMHDIFSENRKFSLAKFTFYTFLVGPSLMVSYMIDASWWIIVGGAFVCIDGILYMAMYLEMKKNTSLPLYKQQVG